MGKHRGKDGEAPQGPYGPGPHPTPEQSAEAGRKFDAQIEANAKSRRSSDK